MTTKKGSGRNRTAGAKAAKKKKSAKLRKLTPRQTNLIEGIVDGKSVRRAALDAGYTENTAEKASKLLSTEAMREFMQKRFSLAKICQRVDEGMDATTSETVIVGRKGKETVSFKETPNFSERRQASALAAKLIGADPAAKMEVKGDFIHEMTVNWVNVDAVDAP